MLISFQTTWFFYYVVFGLKYMGTLNFVSLFVIMGIGADDIFVFVDAWKQSRLQPPEVSGTVVGRLDWTYRRAAFTMLITSLTDACAFYSNVLNSMVVVRIFGVFMGTMVLVNFALVISYFPAVVVLWSRWGYEDSPRCSCRKQPPQPDGAQNSTTPQRQCLERFFAERYVPALFAKPTTRAATVAVFAVVT